MSHSSLTYGPIFGSFSHSLLSPNSISTLKGDYYSDGDEPIGRILPAGLWTEGRVGKPVYSMYSVLYFNIMIIVL